MGEQAQLMDLVYGKGLGDNRRAPPEIRKTHDLKRLHQGHHEALNLRLLGYNEKEIARKLGYTKEAVCLILNSTLAQTKLKQMRLARDGETLDVAKKLHEELVPRAYKVYERILKAEEDDPKISIGLQKKTADTVVKDLAGHGIARDNPNHITVQSLQIITNRGLEAARAEGLIAQEIPEAEIIDDSEETSNEQSDPGPSSET